MHHISNQERQKIPYGSNLGRGLNPLASVRIGIFEIERSRRREAWHYSRFSEIALLGELAPSGVLQVRFASDRARADHQSQGRCHEVGNTFHNLWAMSEVAGPARARATNAIPKEAASDRKSERTTPV